MIGFLKEFSSSDIRMLKEEYKFEELFYLKDAIAFDDEDEDDEDDD